MSFARDGGISLALARDVDAVPPDPSPHAARDMMPQREPLGRWPFGVAHPHYRSRAATTSDVGYPPRRCAQGRRKATGEKSRRTTLASEAVHLHARGRMTTVKPSAHEWRWAAAMVAGLAITGVTGAFFLARLPWSDPVYTPILALGLGSVLQVQVLLIWYWRHRHDFSAECSSSDIDARRRGRCRKELYWWVGEASVVGSVVMTIYSVACLGVSALAGISSGVPATRALVPLLALVVFIVLLVGVGVIRVKWLRRQIQEAPPHA